VLLDPRRPDILLWLSAMEDGEAACVMEAMRTAFPLLSGNSEWRRQIKARVAGLTDRERVKLAKRAERIGECIRRELEAATGQCPRVLIELAEPEDL